MDPGFRNEGREGYTTQVTTRRVLNGGLEGGITLGMEP